MGIYTGFSWAAQINEEQYHAFKVLQNTTEFPLTGEAFETFKQSERATWLSGGSEDRFGVFRLSFFEAHGHFYMAAQGSLKNYCHSIQKWQAVMEDEGWPYLLYTQVEGTGFESNRNDITGTLKARLDEAYLNWHSLDFDETFVAKEAVLNLGEDMPLKDTVYELSRGPAVMGGRRHGRNATRVLATGLALSASETTNLYTDIQVSNKEISRSPVPSRRPGETNHIRKRRTKNKQARKQRRINRK